tara:strand:- start:431 stop:556 length:126 start_codon:yes stop_codon:yes gene_type:complete
MQQKGAVAAAADADNAIEGFPSTFVFSAMKNVFQFLIGLWT